MLLLLTTSGDGTADRLVSRLPSFTFRLNTDQLDQFKLCLAPDWWEIQNPAGLTIDSSRASRVLWWKAFGAETHSFDNYARTEARYIVRELYAWFERRGLRRGNSPLFTQQCGKITVLELAQRFFQTPRSVACLGGMGESRVAANNRVVKSLSSELVGEKKALFTTDVSNRSLDFSFPWFIQQKINAVADVTVFNVGEKFFAFKRDREGLKGLDWRAEQDFVSGDVWESFELSDVEHSKFKRLSSELGVNWGRHDLMLTPDHELIYLEFNANGQWVFLDFQDKHGLVDAVADYIRS